VTIRCGKNDTYVVKPDPDTENGTGFIVHPDGWIATNGHVVKSVFKEDAEHSAESRGASSVTYGRVSGFKLDVNERWVIQTDAPISWGNSGGPAFNRNGEVIGQATFITTSLEGDQAIQGFNFLIPVETLWQMLRKLGVTPNRDAPFMDAWEHAVAAYFQGDYEPPWSAWTPPTGSSRGCGMWSGCYSCSKTSWNSGRRSPRRARRSASSGLI
jgi:S1-C subfamily serine protease